MKYLSTPRTVLGISAVLLALAQAPVNLSLLAWFAVTPLLVHLWTSRDLGSAFRDGLWFGTIYYLCVTYWVYHSMRIYGGLPFPAAVGGTLLLALFLGLYVAVFAAAFRHLIRSSTIPALLTAPILWVALDLLRNFFLTGFPWAALGYSQYRFLALIQIADLTGIHGVTFVLIAVNGAVADVILYRRRRAAFPLFPAAPTVAGLMGLGILVAVVFVYGSYRMGGSDSERGERALVAVVQGNIDQGVKWNPSRHLMIMDKYRVLTQGVLQRSPDIVVWPETSVPFVFGAGDPGERTLREGVKQWGVPLVLGAVRVAAPAQRTGKQREIIANAALLLPAGDTPGGTYDKIHLVPFGEYVPWNLPLGPLVTAVGDFRAGEDNTVIPSGRLRLGVPICYEIIFPNLVRRFVLGGANLIVTITNDAWFGKTSAPYQHFAMAVFRAVENRTPVARAANTGISGFVDAQGRILSRTDLFTEATAVRDLTLRSSPPTVYTRYGDVFAYLCSVASVLLLLLRDERNA